MFKELKIKTTLKNELIILLAISLIVLLGCTTVAPQNDSNSGVELNGDQTDSLGDDLDENVLGDAENPFKGMKDFNIDEHIPQINIPDFNFPDFNIPDFNIPDFNIPDFNIPDFDYEIPQITIPDFNYPDFKLIVQEKFDAIPNIDYAVFDIEAIIGAALNDIPDVNYDYPNIDEIIANALGKIPRTIS